MVYAGGADASPRVLFQRLASAVPLPPSVIVELRHFIETLRGGRSGVRSQLLNDVVDLAGIEDFDDLAQAAVLGRAMLIFIVGYMLTEARIDFAILIAIAPARAWRRRVRVGEKTHSVQEIQEEPHALRCLRLPAVRQFDAGYVAAPVRSSVRRHEKLTPQNRRAAKMVRLDAHEWAWLLLHTGQSAVVVTVAAIATASSKPMGHLG